MAGFTAKLRHSLCRICIKSSTRIPHAISLS